MGGDWWATSRWRTELELSQSTHPPPSQSHARIRHPSEPPVAMKGSTPSLGRAVESPPFVHCVARHALRVLDRCGVTRRRQKKGRAASHPNPTHTPGNP